MNLHEWQLEAYKAIRGGADPSALFEAGVTNFSVYRNAHTLRVSGALGDDFTLLKRLLGKEEFAERIKAFLAEPQSYHQELGALSPAFLAFLERSSAEPTLLRAARLDMLEVCARRAAEPEVGGKVFGLHPSAGLLEMSGRFYVVWCEEGYARRDRLRSQDFKFLSCFVARGELAEISARLEAAGLSQGFVRESAALWTKLGLVISYKD